MFLQNKYRRWYFSIIDKARGLSRGRRFHESHHVIPKCMGGTDDPTNIVLLTPREHFICHLLLPKMVIDKNFKIRLLFALSYFKSSFTSNMYEKYRLEHSECMSSMIWVNNGVNNKRIHPEEIEMFEGWQLGRTKIIRKVKMTQEAKERISKANRGRMIGTSNPSARKVTFEGVTYETVSEAIQKTSKSKYLLKKYGAVFH